MLQYKGLNFKRKNFLKLFFILSYGWIVFFQDVDSNYDTQLVLVTQF